MKLGKSQRSRLKMLLLVGLGAFLVGAALPFASTLSFKLGPPKTVAPVLVALANSPGLDAFPAAASSERLCHVAPSPAHLSAQKAEAPSPNAMFQGGALASASLAFDPKIKQQFVAEPWPNLHPRATLARVPVLMYHDVMTQPEVFFDLTPEQFEGHLQALQENGFTVVSVDQLVQHLRTGIPLPARPIVLSFDDGYAGHYDLVYPLLKKYQMPAVFSVFPGKVDGEIVGRSTLTWEQLKTMAADPLITIAAHSVTHPPDLTQSSDEDLAYEVTASKQRLESQLGIPIRYFTYPAGHYDERVAQVVADAGYLAGFTMREADEQFAGASESLLAVERFGQSNLDSLLTQAWGGPAAPGVATQPFDFSTPVSVARLTIEETELSLMTGGRPVTIHANSRYQVPEILAGTNAIGAVDGGFFSLEYLDSNVMIGPVLSQSTRRFVPGNPSENPLLNSRPLVLIAPGQVKFVPFDASRHNTLAGLTYALPGVTDAFVAAAWLVKDGQPQPVESFGTLFDFDATRHRAFWGINQAGQPVVGVTHTMVDSVTLGELLYQAGLRDAVMVDSGASTSLAYAGESLVGYEPRPVPHVVALIAPEENNGSPCPLVMADQNLALQPTP